MSAQAVLALVFGIVMLLLTVAGFHSSDSYFARAVQYFIPNAVQRDHDDESANDFEILPQQLSVSTHPSSSISVSSTDPDMTAEITPAAEHHDQSPDLPSRL
ncbi:hypothetical protein BDV96DRAFT_685328 [Lophiotrema nucula]|uniref:Uncharacterized protein n=1 Tax=Lophiotrema nucula TaxID=690887 RepID=A0A6A5ZEI1_9PLEO|nr:hypothetical protein BDV96DRAFT_685328 [Lophiotrema nucula]